MRKLLTVLAVLAAGAGGVRAQPQQPPDEIPPNGNYSLAVGEARTLRFSDPIGKVETLNEGIARVTAQSDHTLTLIGVAPGGDHMIVFGPTGEQLFTAGISVAPEPGHLVKVYGGRQKETGLRTSDFTGYYCTETGCGHADGDKPLPSGQTTTITRPLPNGGAMSTTSPN